MTGDVIATRTLTLAGDPPKEVVATFFRPRPDPRGDYRCDFEITGLGAPITGYAPGIDMVQALDLVLKKVGVRLYTSDAYRQGRLTYLGSRDLNFPGFDVPDVAAKD